MLLQNRKLSEIIGDMQVLVIHLYSLRMSETESVSFLVADCCYSFGTRIIISCLCNFEKIL